MILRIMDKNLWAKIPLGFFFNYFRGMYLEKEINKVSLGNTEFSCQDKLRKCVFIVLARSLYSACIVKNI